MDIRPATTVVVARPGGTGARPEALAACRSVEEVLELQVEQVPPPGPG